MAGVINKTARVFNLKTITKDGLRVVVRLNPSFNVVDDQHWAAFKNDDYVNTLKKQGLIEFGTATDDLELEQDPKAVMKVKSKAQKIKGS